MRTRKRRSGATAWRSAPVPAEVARRRALPDARPPDAPCRRPAASDESRRRVPSAPSSRFEREVYHSSSSFMAAVWRRDRRRGRLAWTTSAWGSAWKWRIARSCGVSTGPSRSQGYQARSSAPRPTRSTARIRWRNRGAACRARSVRGSPARRRPSPPRRAVGRCAGGRSSRSCATGRGRAAGGATQTRSAAANRGDRSARRRSAVDESGTLLAPPTVGAQPGRMPADPLRESRPTRRADPTLQHPALRLPGPAWRSAPVTRPAPRSIAVPPTRAACLPARA